MELDSIFKPESVALVGATESAQSVGAALARNLISGMNPDHLFLINPKRETIFGCPAYRNLDAIPVKPDLVVIATPAPTIPQLVEDAGICGARGVIIISAGFKETGPEGLELEKQVFQAAKKHKLRVIGPNCLGVMSPRIGLNATFASDMAKPGNVAFLSQSGALCTAILDWSFQEKVGFSGFVSIGSMADVDWGDLIRYYGQDEDTHSLVIYMETIGNAESFMSAAREVAPHKPIIVIKAGRTEEAAKAACSHTGSLAGSADVLEAAFRQVGALQVNTVEELFGMAEVLSKQPIPKGPRLGILTNAGGPGVLATDALIENGGRLAELSPETLTALNEILPGPWSHGNPVDILGDAGPERYAKAVEILSADPGLDGLLVILTPQSMTDPSATASRLRPFAKSMNKPILACWMGGAEIENGKSSLNDSGIPTFRYPDTAVRAFDYLWKYGSYLKSLKQSVEASSQAPQELAQVSEDSVNKVSEVIRAGRIRKALTLPELESKQILREYGIPVHSIEWAPDEAAVVSIAQKMGYPLVMKLHSWTITHKSDVGGVQLNLQSEEEVLSAFRKIRQGALQAGVESGFEGVTLQPMTFTRDGWELILGSRNDAQFGPVILFGAGGEWVELMQDRSLALPPLNHELALGLMRRTRIYRGLKGFRGRLPVNLDILADIIIRFSALALNHSEIQDIEINPLYVDSEKIVALDARVVLR